MTRRILGPNDLWAVAGPAATKDELDLLIPKRTNRRSDRDGQR
jgi:hypothetical protein